MKNKWVKSIVITLGIAIPIVPILIVINYTTSQQAIFASGSSSILPLMQKFSKVYNKSEIVPTGGGSGKGLEDAAEGNTDFGDMSSNKKSSIINNKTYTDSWKHQRNRTITIAQDAEAIALNIPNDIKYKTEKSGKLLLPKVRPWAIAEMYSTKGAGTVRWSDLLEGATGSSVNHIVNAYGREGGKAASGTSDGFFHTLVKFADYANPKITPDVNHSSSSIKKTPESNAQAYDVLNSGDSYGLTYLSLGYIGNILDNNSSNNRVKLGFVDTQSGNSKNNTSGKSLSSGKTWAIPTISNSANGTYGWIRPFNIAFSANNADSALNKKKEHYIYDFINWVLSSEGQKYVQELLLVPLPTTIVQGKINTIDQLKTIGYKKTKSDFDLNSSSNPLDNQYAFGWQE